MLRRATVAAAALLCAAPVSADFFALTFEATAAQTDTANLTGSGDTPWQGDMTLRFKHPIPLIPNVAIGHANRQQNDAADGERTQAELYYNLFNSLGIYFDIGLGMEWWNAEHKLALRKDNGHQLHAVTRLAWSVPATRIGLETQLEVPLWDEHFSRAQWRTGARFEFMNFANASLRGGFQREEVRAQGRSYETSGAYFGLGFKI